jgi:hypothetical protein
MFAMGSCCYSPRLLLPACLPACWCCCLPAAAAAAAACPTLVNLSVMPVSNSGQHERQPAIKIHTGVCFLLKVSSAVQTCCHMAPGSSGRGATYFCKPVAPPSSSAAAGPQPACTASSRHGCTLHIASWLFDTHCCPY